MRTYIKLIFAGLVILAGSSFAASVNQQDPNTQDTRLQKYRIKRALGEKVMSWLSDANDSAAVECDRLADSLLSLEEPGVSSYFIAAQVANLREKRDKAISILENVIGRYPDEKAPIGIVLPVKIVGRFWIGTIARQSGDIAKAKNVYETILTMLESSANIQGLEDKGGMIMICNLHLAEIESLHMKRKDLALAKLKAIQQIKKPAGPLGAGYDIYKSWAAYQHTRISRGKTQATQELVAPPEMMSAPLLAATELLLNGIAGEPLAGSDKGMNIVTEILVNRAIKSPASPIDRSLARLGYGFDQQYKGNFAKAEKHYSAMFEEDSYFSPMAGLLLARCKKAQGKTAEAESVLEQVRAKYPGYDSAVTELKESWNKSKNN